MVHHRIARNTPAARGFTLAEIVVVIAIMTILVTLTASSMNGLMGSLHMKEGVTNARHMMEQARQEATTMNRDVVVRFYRVPDDMGVLAWRACAYGTEKLTTDPDKPQYHDPTVPGYRPPFVASSPMERLPGDLVFHPAAAYSLLLDATQSALQCGEELAPDGEIRQFTSFRFTPDGRCTLPAAQSWTITLVSERDLAKSPGLPPGYATLQLDPSTARVRVYRR
ncbi:uncharacterized protein (TIGR02596 family) [Roseimicrobium gellanilyticum]|uniref:Uncharacterized protein (TIGR02596 family) n=1 Tax=Roseimicrobium gellanilyticum TaxID=748857 RepID=A0A366HK77_9BACT|nr:Verru_Chthon cassette protein D [Roseimicrobium gellanilyticum]RBP42644.1 uncharacterized protein (TIGR02596 family) [Roseimicrobium gellanilyticum]